MNRQVTDHFLILGTINNLIEPSQVFEELVGVRGWI